MSGRKVTSTQGGLRQALTGSDGRNRDHGRGGLRNRLDVSQFRGLEVRDPGAHRPGFW